MLAPGISREVLFDKLGFVPHPGQQEFLDSKARFKIPTCGRRWGKTHTGARTITEGLMIPNTRYWIVGPHYGLGEKEFRVIYDDFFIRLEKSYKGLTRDFKKSYDVKQGNMSIRTPWNSFVEVKSAEKPDSLVGEGLTGVIMAEAALHRKDTWDMYVRPALTDERGWAIFPSTPRGHNWYEGLWLMGQDPKFKEYESWRFPSWDNIHIYPLGRKDPEIKSIEDEISDYHFLQEYAAEFTAFEGKIYDEFKHEVHVIDIQYNPFWHNYLAFDYGFSDPTVCLDIMVDGQGRCYVWREYYVTQKTAHQHGMNIKMRDNPPNYHVDGRFDSGHEPEYTQSISQFVGPIVGRNIPIIDGIESVKRQLKIRPDGTPGMYIDRSCVNTIRQLSHLHTPESKDGKSANERLAVRVQHDFDDHTADAVRYFCGEYYLLGYGNSNLSDIYSRRPTDAQEFFSNQQAIHLDGFLTR